ncbi:hypothetical protein FRC01_007227 [Tulasnella sp. 417]|nr:hypothetical protein FRC01_007227 [Tulasnella sp. 417]
MLAQLPTELKISIIEHVDKASLPAVLRTNSSFHDFTEPILYSVVELFPFKSGAFKPAVECLRAIVARPSVAAAMRTLYVSLRDRRWAEDDIVRELFEALGKALLKLNNLEKLELPNWDGTDRSCMEHIPRGSALPSLRHYYGPAEVIDSIQSYVLATVYIETWRPRAVEVSRTLLAAARFCAGTLRALEIVKEESDDEEQWLRVVLQLLPLFPKLRFLGLGDWNTLDNRLMDQLTPGLRAMEDLRLFYIGEAYVITPDREEEIVRHLHEGCPQLRAIAPGGEDWRFSEEFQQWVPPPSCRLSSQRTNEIWARSDYQKYLVDPQTDGFDYQLTNEDWRW